jgi:hypothetical protein
MGKRDLQFKVASFRSVLGEHMVFTTRLIVVFIASLAMCRGGPTCVKTTGDAHVSRMTTDGREIPSATYSAPVSVTLSDDGRFIIQLFNHQFYKRRPITFSFDGTNFFYVIGNGTNTSRFQTVVAQGYLSAEEMPLILIDDPAREALWYALCSGTFFKRHGQSGEILELFRSPRRSIVGYGYRYEVALTNTIFCMPYRLDIWRSKKGDKATRAAEEDRLELNAIGRGTALYDNQWFGKAAIPDGSHALELLWKREQILQDERLPLEVKIVNFYPAKNTPLPCLKIRLEFGPWHLSAVDNETFRPPDPTEPMHVMDARVRVREGSHYLDELSYSLGTSPTNSRWYPTNDPWIQAGIRIISKAQRIPSGSSKSRVFVLVLFVSTSLVFLYLLFRKRWT